MRHLDLFSGIGGFALAASWVWGQDHEIVSFCEIDPFCRKVLKKHWPDAPIHDDIKTLFWEAEECEMRHKDKQTPEISTLPKKQNLAEGLPLNVNNVGLKNLYRQASLFGETDGNIVHGNAEERQCEAKTGPILEVVTGCEERETQTIKTERDTTGPEENTKIKYHNGEGGFLQEMITHAKFVKSNPKNQDNSTPTTSKAGRNTQNSDSTSQTGEHYAKSATKKSMRGKVDLLTAGVPCQPASCAGKRKGVSDDRWLWGETFRIIREAKPTWVILENVRGLLSLEGGMVFENLLLELEALGYETTAFIIPACAVNAPHRRDRVWIVANFNKHRLQEQRPKLKTNRFGQLLQAPKNTIRSGVRGGRDGNQAGCERPLQTKRSDCNASDPCNERLQGSQRPGAHDERPASHGSITERNSAWDEPWIEAATRFCGISYGVSNRVDRLKSLGNAIVPQVVYPIMKAIKEIES